MNINLPPKRNYKENKKHELYAHLENPKNTIDAVIFGGAEYIIDDKELEDVTEQKYGDEIKTVSNIFQKLLKFTPTIISGQNRIKSEIGDNDLNKHYQHFYFDTENRRLYIFKPNIDSINKNTNQPHQI